MTALPGASAAPTACRGGAPVRRGGAAGGVACPSWSARASSNDGTHPRRAPCMPKRPAAPHEGECAIGRSASGVQVAQGRRSARRGGEDLPATAATPSPRRRPRRRRGCGVRCATKRAWRQHGGYCCCAVRATVRARTDRKAGVTARGGQKRPEALPLDTLCLLAGCSLPRPLCRTDVAGSTPMKSRTLVDSAAHLGGDAAQTCSAPGGHALTPPPPALSLLPACLLRCAACLQPWARTRTCRSCGARSSRT